LPLSHGLFLCSIGFFLAADHVPHIVVVALALADQFGLENCRQSYPVVDVFLQHQHGDVHDWLGYMCFHEDWLVVSNVVLVHKYTRWVYNVTGNGS